MVIHNNSLSILKNIDNHFTLKPLSIGETDIYLGAKLSKITSTNGFCCCIMIPSKYVQEAEINCEIHMKEQCGGKYYLVNNAANPSSYHY